ncbi:MAG: hypothetical protein U5K30_07925 [Acidimicrobiales bacterium]|nr:hypothetical protein [Acidimicrobiales bacterium]
MPHVSARVVAFALSISALVLVLLVTGSDTPSATSPGPTAGDAEPTSTLPRWATSPTLSWAPPELDDPETISVSTEPDAIKLDPDRDYRIELPSSPVTRPVAIDGGRNVVLIGGEIAIPWQGEEPYASQRRGLLLRDQTGVVHVEGLLIRGEDVSEGIQIDAEDATVQLQSIRIENLHARDQVDFSDNHPDVVQPYGGVDELRIDRLTGETDYQGLFLAEDLGPIGSVDLRRVNIRSTETARYLLWASGTFPLSVQEVYADPAPGRSWDKTVRGGERWAAAEPGRPADGDFVTSDDAGIGYRGPGYVE